MKFSVIIAAYNAENYLQRAVKSLLKQKFRDFELLIIDDGSTDSTLKIAEGLAQQDRRIRVISQQNEGVSVARNNGISDAKGDYIQFVDADDVVNDMFLSDLVRQTELGADVVISDYRTGDEFGKNGADSYFHLLDQNLSGYDATLQLLKNQLPNFSWAYCVKRDLYVKHSLSFPAGRIFEDNSLFYRLLFVANRVKVSSKKNYLYVQRPDSYVHIYSQKSIEDILVMLDEVISFARLQGGRIDGAAQEYLIKRYFKAFTMCVVGQGNDDNSKYLSVVNVHIKQMQSYRPMSKKLRVKQILWRLGLLKFAVLYSNRHLAD
ncbi:glycosyltransferase family 2 protein [Lacticaseibacillus pantheris]|uniref:glycosyltransferase family 2 protein n=1 Tax=Lacticaseibacillus pantheris TaxID=171523 RepID=UPI002657D57E|nr:glycosyltransferase family 2 protein [Lacticaseibacillus pantheris]WKF84753.1 glycosyltransferase family 2 protein [Lacticaseibacillus pantheris]